MSFKMCAKIHVRPGHCSLQMLCDVWHYGAYVRQDSGPSGAPPSTNNLFVSPVFLMHSPASGPAGSGVPALQCDGRVVIRSYRIPCKISTTSALSCQWYTDAT